MSYDSEYGKHWFFWMLAGAVIASTACLPPQRRAGIWEDNAGNVAPWYDAYRADRVEFGYIPSFRPPTNVGNREAIGYNSAISTSDVGSYRYSSYRWAIDWLWVAAAILLSAVFVFIGRSFAPRPRVQISD
jgi:hypothetical protein